MINSISASVILRGTRSAGYGFVALSTAEAVQNAVELLNKKQLDDRQIIVEVAKPADQKDKERKDRKPRRRLGRRGSKAVPGEVTEAEANGEVKAEDAPPVEGEATKPKKKKKKAVVSFHMHFHLEFQHSPRIILEETEGHRGNCGWRSRACCPHF